MGVEPPRSPMPSLNALRAFEAAARHESFVDAAEELHVTAGAIAQQVKTIEAWAGQPLFQRQTHGVCLIPEARLVLPNLVEAFNGLGTVVQRLRNISQPTEIRIAALPSIAMLWLLPRLTKLHQDFPELEISVSAIENPPDAFRDPYDLALFFVDQEPERAEAITLSEDKLFPVCAPFLFNESPIYSPADLAGHTLLHDSVWSEDWRHWLFHANEKSVNSINGLTFSLYSIALHAAIEGNGVLIGHQALIGSALHERKLVTPFPDTKLHSAPLKLLMSPEEKHREKVSELVSWFVKESHQG